MTTSSSVQQPTDRPSVQHCPNPSCFTVPRSLQRLGSVRDERGQTTAEYALVLIAAATIAMLIVAWAGNTGAISDFFDTIVERITSMLP